MKISVITVCYNSEATIQETINSVFLQDYGDIEYLIIDGLSTDRTREIISKHEHAQSISLISEQDDGLWDAMN